MAQRTTEWRPDTCGCVITYIWDDALPPEARAHHPTDVRACPAHAHLSPHAAYAQVLDGENRVKNAAVAEILDATGLTDLEVSFSFDAKRNLTLKVPMHAKATALRRQAALDQRFGAGKVRVD